MKQDLTNKFFDINKFPKEPGILLFPISMGQIETSQSGKKCFEYIDKNLVKKINIPKVGLNVVYGDYLYMHSNIKVSDIRKQFVARMISHKRELQSRIEKK